MAHHISRRPWPERYAGLALGAAFLSAMASGLAVIAAQDELETPFGRGLRLAVRLAGAALAACLL